jgi:hypothetical protein
MSQLGQRLSRPITADDVAAYRREGYFLYHAPVFPPATQARLTALFEEHVAALPAGKCTDELDTPHFADHRTRMHFYPERNANHKLWLARGKDLGNNRYEA